LLFLGAVKGEETTAMDFVSNCARIGIGGPLVGIAGGALAAYFLSRIIRDDIQTANVTFIACYLSFWVAEYTFLKVSGVVVVVVLALYLSAMAKTRIHP
jgi:NhaP-type Na+/H+ or K+/H+ antiporter